MLLALVGLSVGLFPSILQIFPKDLLQGNKVEKGIHIYYASLGQCVRIQA